jgi:hypothetical protein
MAEQEERPGLIARAQGFIQSDRQKWGGMSVGAHARLGLAELRQAVSLGGNVEQATPFGMWGNVTPGEIAAGRQSDSSAAASDQEPSLSPADIANDRGLYGPDHEAGMDRGSVHGEHLATPADIANDRQGEPELNQGQEHGQVQQDDQHRERGGRAI